MTGIVRILQRFIFLTIIIFILLTILNFIILGTYFFKDMSNEISPENIVKNISQSLNSKNDTYYLDSESKLLLNKLNCWAMLINNNGIVSWSYNLPKQIPLKYSLSDVAQLSRNYLLDYPVFIWKHNNGIVVVGYPKNSLAKYNYIFPYEWVKLLPYKVITLITINILLALFISILMGSLLIKSIKPLIKGIQSLSDDIPVNLEAKGMLKDIAVSINNTSLLLQKKNNLLKSRDEARSNWIAGISHDIRTPLSMILGYSSELEDSNLINNEQKKQASIIRQQSEKIQSLVNDLNLVSMLEYEMQPLNIKPLRLSALARKIAAEFLNNGLEDKYTLHLKIENEKLTIDGDEKLLTRAITNLVQNSITHNPQGCDIVIQTTLDNNNNYHFIVSDNGNGVPKNELNNITELPYSKKRKNHIYTGHGLGLPMVKRIVMAHKGLLTLTSDIGKGMTADITFISQYKS